MSKKRNSAPDFVTIDAPTLHHALKPVTAVINRRNAIPVLGYALIRVRKDGTHIWGTDLDRYVSVAIDDIDASGDWEICLPARELIKIARSSGCASVRIQSDGAVTAGDASYQFTCAIPGEEFPKLAYDHTTEQEIERFSNGSLAELLGKVSDFGDYIVRKPIVDSLTNPVASDVW